MTKIKFFITLTTEEQMESAEIKRLVLENYLLRLKRRKIKFKISPQTGEILFFDPNTGKLIKKERIEEIVERIIKKAKGG